MSTNQNQHYVSQSYQRGWIDTSGRLHVYRWAYNKLVCEPKATKSTGGRDGLYFIPMAPPGEQNKMEDVFWKRIDQGGADGLALLRSNDPAKQQSRLQVAATPSFCEISVKSKMKDREAAKIDKAGWAKFLSSLLFRNPNGVKYLNAWAKQSVLNGCLKDDYGKHRRPHEPDSFEEFKVALEQPGMTELSAECFRYLVEKTNICDVILKMEWQVVTVPTTSDPILTSDVPIIIHGGMQDDDGCLILPLSTNEFFVAYNLGKIDMRKEIGESVASGRFVRSMNKYVVEHRIDCVYGIDDSLMAFVARYWGISEAPYFPSLTMPPVLPLP